ncbi:hypothetical protein BH11ACT6_BH11ACT6_19700 [soil metagenome]
MIRVASVPAAHPYVEAVIDPERVAVLPDPISPGATLPGQWWPPRFLDPGYLATRLDDIDVLHVHFGFDSTPPAVLHHVAALLTEHQIPLVVTVHDLDNPHFADSTDHRNRLGVLIGAASAVITLTAGAAGEIERTWGRRATVLPHPHVLALEQIGTARKVRTQPVVALHGKGLRANIDPWPVLDALLAESGTTWRLRLDLDQEALTSPRSAEVSDARLAAYRSAGVDVRVHPRFSDAALADYLTEIDVMVLPYRSGTHSGWVEACYDAGVCAVVPDCGHFGDQHPFPVYGFSRAGLDVAGLVHAVGAARSAQPLTGQELRRQRRDQRVWVRDQMAVVYAAARPSACR